MKIGRFVLVACAALAATGASPGEPQDEPFIPRASLEEVFEDPEKLHKEIDATRKKMHAAAKKLDFERAAEYRDRLKYLQTRALLT